MDMTSRQVEILSQIAEVDAFTQRLGTLRAQVADLTQKAAHDPEAQARLAKLQQVWSNGIRQQVEQMREKMKAVVAGSPSAEAAASAEGPNAQMPATKSSEHEIMPKLCRSVKKMKRFC